MDGATLNTFFGVLVIILGGVSTLLYTNQKTLRDSRDDLEKRVAFLEGKSQRDDITIERQDAAIEALRKTVTGEVHLVSISDMVEHISADLNSHHLEASAKWETIIPALAAIGDTMIGVKESIDRLNERLERQRREET